MHFSFLFFFFGKVHRASGESMQPDLDSTDNKRQESLTSRRFFYFHVGKSELLDMKLN